jgi:hypothetical protein
MSITVALPAARPGKTWELELVSTGDVLALSGVDLLMPARSVAICAEA